MRQKLRQTADFCRWSLYLTIVIVALALTAGRLLIGRLYLYQDSIESWLSSILLVSVSTERAAGLWEGIFPVIELDQVRLGSADSQAALIAGSVRAVPDYVRSFRYANTVWHELTVNDVQINLQQQESGRWALSGLESTGAGNQDSLSRLVEMVFRSQSIQIKNLQVNFHFADESDLVIAFEQVSAQNDGEFHRMIFSAQEGSNENSVDALIELGGHDFQFSSMRGQAYLGLKGADLAFLVRTFLTDFGIDRANSLLPGRGEIWVDIEPGNISAEGSLSLAGIVFGDLPQVSLDAYVRAAGTADDDWSLDILQTQLQIDELKVPEIDLHLSRTGSLLRIQTTELDLEPWQQVTAAISSASPNLKEALDALSPRGLVQNALLELPLLAVDNWRFTSNLRAFSVDTYESAPALENLQVYIEITPSAGRAIFDSANTQMDFPNLFAEPLLHERLTGQVDWRAERATQTLKVFSSAIQSRGEYGSAVGQFRLVTALDGGFPSDFTLVSGLRNGLASDWPKFVPVNLSQGLYNWLAASNVEGGINEAGFIYRGAIASPIAPDRTVQLRGLLDQGGLRYADGWPRIEALQGGFGLSDGLFQGDLSAGFIAGLDLGPLSFSVHRGDWMQIDLIARGGLENMVDLLRDTPVRQKLGAGLDPLVFVGQATAEIGMMLPLRETGASGPEIEISVQLDGNGLLIPSMDLAVESISGPIRYNNSGLWADGISAQLWQKPVELKIETTSDIRIQWNTEIQMDSLQEWRPAALLQPFTGSAEVEGEIIVPWQNAGLIRYALSSSTEGVLSEAPTPLAKSASESRLLTLMVVDAPLGPLVEARWGDYFDLSVNLDKTGKMQQGAFAIDADRPQKIPGQLLGHLNLQSMDILEWQKYLFPQSATAASYADLDLTPDVAIRSYNSSFDGMALGPLQGRFRLQEGDVQFDFQSAFGGGILRYQGPQSDLPYDLQLDWANLTSLPGRGSASGAEAESDEDILEAELEATGLSGVDPARVPPIRVSIKELQSAERSLGQWSFAIRPVENGLEVTDLQASFSGGSIQPAQDDASDSAVEPSSRASLSWTREGLDESTHILVGAEVTNVADLFSMFDQPRALRSETGLISADLSWAGAPWQGSIENASGQMTIAFDTGNFNAEVQGVGSALMKLVGLFNIQTWGRRLKFDFSDLTGDGTFYDTIRGSFDLHEGTLTTASPVVIDLSSGRLRFDGEVNLITNQVNAELVANLPVRDNLAWIGGVVAGLPVAAGIWLVGELFKDQLDSIARVTYSVTGDLDAPEVEPRAAEEI